MPYEQYNDNYGTWDIIQKEAQESVHVRLAVSK